MIGDFLLRIAVALPLILMLAVGILLAARRGWLPLPGLPGAVGTVPWQRAVSSGAAGERPALDVVAIKGVAPALRLAVVRFRGEELLVGVAPQGFQLLVRQSPPADSADATGRMQHDPPA
ncbi:MAG: flagellar biosynthetic protein FliO [Thermaurantiacus sp.]